MEGTVIEVADNGVSGDLTKNLLKIIINLSR